MPEKLKEWKEALQSVSFLTGHEISSNFNISDCQNIVSAVHKEVQRKKSLHVAKYPVGLHRLVKDFEKLCLDRLVEDFERQCKTNEGGKEKAQVVGIFGMGGVGKTTLAKELFNRKRSQYSQSCFLFDVREAYANKSFPCLQRKLLKDLFALRGRNFHCTEEGTSFIGDCIRRSNQLSFLIVVDDIDHLEQLDALMIGDMLNKSGNSLVIVTTRDAGVLIKAGITFGYYLKGMDRDEAKELFCWHAFSQSYPSSGYENLVDPFVNLCGGLPLSLQVLGSHVHGTDENFWALELKKVNKTLPRDIHKRLKISIDTLDNEEKQIFIDVACFFIGQSKKDAIKVWEASGWSAQHALRRLINKCLVEEIKHNKEMTSLRMHDHLRDLGREMADELSHPRRLWRPQHIKSLESKGFENILTQAKDRFLHSFWDPSTKFDVKFFLGESGNMAETSTALLWLQLNLPTQKTLTPIPPWIPLQNLQSLSISHGKLERLWQNDEQAPFALKELRIDSVFELKELRLGLLRCLENIRIYYCENLESVTGIANLTKLVELDVSICRELQELSLGHLLCLEKIKIYDCENLKSVTGIADLTKLVELDISVCGKLEELSLGHLLCLEKIKICNCKNLKSVSGIADLTKLVELDISVCGKLEELSLDHLCCLEKIRICDCENLKSVTGIANLTKLVELDIRIWGKLEELSLDHLCCLEKIRICECENLKSVTGIANLTKLVELHIIICEKLEELSLSLSHLCCLKKIIIARCGNLKSVIRLSDLMMLKELGIFSCEQIEKISLVRLSSLYRCSISRVPMLKNIEVKDCKNLTSVDVTCFWNPVKLKIDGCPHLEKIPNTILHSLEGMQLLYCSNETIRYYILQMENHLPSEFIKVIGKAADGAESTLNENLFCDFLCYSLFISKGTKYIFNHLGGHHVHAIILCAVVVVNTYAAAKAMNESMRDCDWSPWVKFEVRQGEWIITSVTTKEDDINSYLVNKGYCSPFDSLCSPEDALMKSVTMPVMKGEEHKIFEVLSRIVHTLYR